MVSPGSSRGNRGIKLLQKFYGEWLKYDCMVVIILLSSKLS